MICQVLKSIIQRLTQEFLSGNFFVYKTKHKMSGIAFDQGYEQNSDIVKGFGGATGLTENKYR